MWSELDIDAFNLEDFGDVSSHHCIVRFAFTNNSRRNMHVIIWYSNVVGR